MYNVFLIEKNVSKIIKCIFMFILFEIDVSETMDDDRY